MDTRKGGHRYCPNCKRVVETRVLLEGYRQVEVHGILAKKRQVICGKDRQGTGSPRNDRPDGSGIHTGGCGTRWFTLEIPEEQVLGAGRKKG